MRLVLTLDAPWSEAAAADGEALAFSQGDTARLYTTALYDRAAPPARRAANDELGIEVIGETEMRSALGWPVRVIERMVTGKGGARREMEVRYAFFEYGGTAVVIAPADSFVSRRDELLAAALAGRPDWSGEIACIAALLPSVTST